jgi:hypothetical protein
VLLYDHGRITYDSAGKAIQQTHASKRLKRNALVLLEELKRHKDG